MGVKRKFKRRPTGSSPLRDRMGLRALELFDGSNLEEVSRTLQAENPRAKRKAVSDAISDAIQHAERMERTSRERGVPPREVKERVLEMARENGGTLKPYRASRTDAPQWAVFGEESVDSALTGSVTEEDGTVLSYSLAMRSLYVSSRQNAGPNRRRASRLWSLLKDARLFHFSPRTYVELRHEVDVYTTEVLADLDWLEPGAGSHSAEDADKYVNAISDNVKNVPFPDRLPFARTFFGFGYPGVRVPLYDVRHLIPDEVAPQIEEGYLIGYLLAEERVAVGFYMLMRKNGTGGVTVEVYREEGSDAWTNRGLSLNPWIVVQFVKIVNEHRTFLLPESSATPRCRQNYKRNRKDMGLKRGQWAYTPPPYYVLPISSKVIRETVRRNLPRPRAPTAYRTDVRAHERCRIRRGKLPLDPKLRRKLQRRGYEIFTVNDLDVNALRKLQERNVPFKRTDEWMAILTTWVESHYTNNDPKLPYVPATRKPMNVRVGSRPISRGWDDPAAKR